MVTRAELHANFAISARATAVILALMNRVAEEDGEYPEALAIKWARIIFNDGFETPYDVHIGFYDRATFPGHDPGQLDRDQRDQDRFYDGRAALPSFLR